MTNGRKSFQAHRPKNAPEPDPVLVPGLEVTESDFADLRDDELPTPSQHVWKEHRVALKGQPLEGLAIVDIVPRAWK